MGCVTSRDVQAPGPVQPPPASAGIPSKQGPSKEQRELPLKSKQQLVAAPYVPALQATSSVDFQIPTQGKFSEELRDVEATKPFESVETSFRLSRTSVLV